MTYKIYLDKKGKAVLPEIDTPHGKAVKCKCGSTEWPHAMIDVRAFDSHLTEGEKFVCSGCYSTWEREKRKIHSTDDFLVAEEFTAKFIEIKTGKKDLGAEAVRLEYLEKEKARIMEDELRYVLAPDDHPDKVAIKSKRVELEKRIKKG